jgi:hypothetical protein
LALEGLLKPQSFLTNCNDAARISSSVAGGSKLNSVLMFLHIANPSAKQLPGVCLGTRLRESPLAESGSATPVAPRWWA